MHDAAERLTALDSMASHWIRIVGIGVESFGVLVIVVGIAWSTFRFLQRRMAEQHYDAYKIRIGRSLLLGLEVLVAADIAPGMGILVALKSAPRIDPPNPLSIFRDLACVRLGNAGRDVDPGLAERAGAVPGSAQEGDHGAVPDNRHA